MIPRLIQLEEPEPSSDSTLTGMMRAPCATPSTWVAASAAMVPATWVPCPCRSDVSDAPPGDVVKFWPGTRAARSSGWTATPVSRTATTASDSGPSTSLRSEEHTSELQSRQYLVCRLLL